MTLPAFEPFPVAPLRRALGALARLASRVPVGLERIPRTGPVVLAARHYPHLFDPVGFLRVFPRELHGLVTLSRGLQPHVQVVVDGAHVRAVLPRDDHEVVRDPQPFVHALAGLEVSGWSKPNDPAALPYQLRLSAGITLLPAYPV